MTGHAIASAADLPKLVGYKQLRELYGWPKRTIQDWIKARKFPRPLNLPGRENYWALDDIVTWIKGDMAQAAVFRPEDLAPGQLSEVAVDLLIRAAEHEIGEPIDPEGLCITYTPPSPCIPEDEFAEAERKEAAIFQQRFSDLDAARSSFVAAWLFPELRKVFADEAINAGLHDLFLDAERLQRVALCALTKIPGVWEDELQKLKAIR